ncbi:MAG TPA: NAD(P)H-dependent oxidoreductase subunit E, partial [Pseudomonadota bacterium]|nr:NAD(P)H-dependent oxidoreductase subunit E [Pseudomonadota bacterium]
MKATGNFEQVKDINPKTVLSSATIAHIDHWAAKFP